MLQSKSSIWAIVIALSIKPTLAVAETRRIITYIDDVQEERKSTRWTLTEWLRIKERMKMMDLWLAMFSDPKKDKFAPELSLQYGQSKGQSLYSYGAPADFSALNESKLKMNHSQEQGQLQFWFTNLVSSSTGLRTINIDLGLEFAFKNRFMIKNQNISHSSLPDLKTMTQKLNLKGGNLRIFGANIQDSNLVGKFGFVEINQGPDFLTLASLTGRYAGAETRLYFLNWFGLAGQYLSLSGANFDGKIIEYGGFLELKSLRLSYLLYQHMWSVKDLTSRLDLDEKGAQGAVGLLF